MAMSKAEKAVVERLHRTLALRWPTAAKTEPLFGFGDYDRPFGEVKEGAFYVASGRGVERVVIRARNDKDQGWQRWRFTTQYAQDTTSVPRGGYYDSEKDACLFVLWEQCERAARELRAFWKRYEEAE
jgi:hypothetical protein